MFIAKQTFRQSRGQPCTRIESSRGFSNFESVLVGACVSTARSTFSGLRRNRVGQFWTRIKISDCFLDHSQRFARWMKSVCFFAEANHMKDPKTIRSLFTLPGFVASSRLQGVFGDRYARVIQLTRRKKPQSVRVAATAAGVVTTGRCYGYVICRSPAGASTLSLNAGASAVRGAMGCM